MRILVVGSGAVGSYFGGLLALSGHDVLFVARGAQAEAMRERGLALETGKGELRVERPELVETLAEAQGSQQDLVLVTVKWRDLPRVLDGLAAPLAPDGVIVPLLNGLDSERRIAERHGRERVVGGVAMIAASRPAPGRVSAPAGGSLRLAPLEPGQRARVDRLARELARSFPCDVDDDLDRMLYEKLLWNAPFSALCALTRSTAGQVLECPELEWVVREAMREVLCVARAEGVELPDSASEQMVSITRRVFPMTVPSMLQDVLAGLPTETDILQGALVRLADRHGLPVPVCRVLHALMLGLEPRQAAEANRLDPPAAGR